MPKAEPWRSAWTVGGFILMCIALAVLEIDQPYYFAQDDNFAAALPVHLLGCRAFFQGRFPAYNPYQFLGAPLNTTGCYMFLYPFLYLSYVIARWVLHNASAMEDVFCIMHLVAGYWSCILLGRTLGLRPSTATVAACSFTLSGFSLIAGRSWDNTTPLVAYLPLTFVLLITLIRTEPDWKWVARSACLIALFMNSGFVQLWIYSMIFAALYLGAALLTRRTTPRRIAWIAPAVLIGLAPCMPLLLSFHQTTEGWTRTVAEGPRIVWSNLFNMLLPASLAPSITNGPQAFRWGSTYYRDMGELYYAGTILTAIGIASTIPALVRIVAKNGRRKTIARNTWGLLAILALLCGVGSQSVFWPLMRMLPLMRQMESPFKFAPFVTLFLLMQGATAFDGWVRRRGRPLRWEAAFAACSVLLLCWHISLCKPAFYTYGDHPYPKLPAAEESLLSSSPRGRVFTIAPYRSIVPGFVSSLSNEWATQYGIYAAFGYDPPVEVLPSTDVARRRFASEPLAALRAYGVRWVVVHRTALRPLYGPNPLIRDLETVDPSVMPVYLATCYRQRPILATPDVLVFEVPNADPLAFARSGDRRIPLAVQTSANGVDIDITGNVTDVVVDFAMRRGFSGDIDGKPIELRGDNWGRIEAALPAGARHLHLRYAMPWAASLAGALCCLGLGVALAFALRRSQAANSPGIDVVDAGAEQNR